MNVLNSAEVWMQGSIYLWGTGSIMNNDVIL